VPMRLSGLGSGMDIDKMVSDIMRAERIPLDKMKQKKQSLSWKTELYREVNTKLTSFRTFLNGMRFSSNFVQFKASSSDETKVSVKANDGANAVAHKIEVERLATGAKVGSSNGISSIVGVDIPGNNSTQITAGVNDKINITVDGVTKTLVLGTGTYTNDQLKTALQAQIDSQLGGGKVNVSLDGSRVKLTPVGTAQLSISKVAGNAGIDALGLKDKQNGLDLKAELWTIADQFKIPLDQSDGDFKINGVTISYKHDDTLASIITKVNTSAAGVMMSYDSATDKITFTSKGVGSGAQINLENGSLGNFLDAIGVGGEVGKVVSGTDAKVKIDGEVTYRNSNSFTLDGATYTLRDVTTAPVNVTVSQDNDQLFNKIKEFVTQYNDVIDLVAKRSNEARFRSFDPLTDEQKSEMKDADIKLWEEKAKSGLLRNDDILESVSGALRGMLSSTVESIPTEFNALFKVGITTMPYNRNSPNDAGKLIIDETKLKKAIAEDPSGVASLFTNQPIEDTSISDEAERKADLLKRTGVAQAMYDKINSTISRIISKAGGASTSLENPSTDLGFQLNKLNRNIEDFNRKLDKKMDNYYRQFTAMDQAIAKGNAQMSWLSQQFR